MTSLVTARSRTGTTGLRVTVAVLLAALMSVWSRLVRVAEFATAVLVSTLAVIVRVTVVPSARAGMDEAPVLAV